MGITILPNSVNCVNIELRENQYILSIHVL